MEGKGESRLIREDPGAETTTIPHYGRMLPLLTILPLLLLYSCRYIKAERVHAEVFHGLLLRLVRAGMMKWNL